MSDNNKEPINQRRKNIAIMRRLARGGKDVSEKAILRGAKKIMQSDNKPGGGEKKERGKRRVFTPEQKLKIVLRGLGYYPVEELCADYEITPTHYYVWRRQFLTKAHLIFGGLIGQANTNVGGEGKGGGSKEMAESILSEMKKLLNK